VTCGAAGSDRDRRYAGESAAAGISGERVDPTGAGDVFVSSFIYGSSGMAAADRLLFANLCAGLSVQSWAARSAPRAGTTSWHDRRQPDNSATSIRVGNVDERGIGAL